MKMTKSQWKQFVASVLIYGITFSLVYLILDLIMGHTNTWYFYLISGSIFGILMSAWTMYSKRKKK